MSFSALSQSYFISLFLNAGILEFLASGQSGAGIYKGMMPEQVHSRN
jgi:hypothetical protein